MSETDKQIFEIGWDKNDNPCQFVPAEFARSLERERDEALSQIVKAECRAERFCQERDEAREALRELYFAVQRKLTECAPANDINAPGESPLPLEVIPNHMGINLCSVESLEWTRQADGQLASLTIAFIPANVSNNV